MKTEIKAGNTSTPWKAQKPKTKKHENSRWIMGNNIYIAKVYGGTQDIPNQETTEANAEFIVRAVNSHEALLASLKWARTTLKMNGKPSQRDFEDLDKTIKNTTKETFKWNR